MSKSLGNTLTIRELVKRHDPEASGSTSSARTTGSPLEFGEERIEERARALERLRALVDGGRAARRARHAAARPGPRLLAEVAAQRERFEAAMDDDFNTPQALGVLFDLAPDAPGRARPR